MQYRPASTITISKEDGKLVVVRKPVVQTWRERNGGCLVAIMIFVALMVFSLTMSYFHILHNSGKEEADTWLLLISVIPFSVFIVIVGLVVREKLRQTKNVRPPDYDDEILIFDIDEFTVKKEGMVIRFSYRYDVKPVLCFHPHYGPVLPGRVSVSIPCNPLDDYVPYDCHRGFYEMWSVDKSDAEHILTALREHLGISHADG